MNVIARLEYELAYYDSAVQRFNHYTSRTPLVHSGFSQISECFNRSPSTLPLISSCFLPPKERESRRPASFAGIHRTRNPHFRLAWATLSGARLPLYKWMQWTEFKILSKRAFNITLIPKGKYVFNSPSPLLPLQLINSRADWAL